MLCPKGSAFVELSSCSTSLPFANFGNSGHSTYSRYSTYSEYSRQTEHSKLDSKDSSKASANQSSSTLYKSQTTLCSWEQYSTNTQILPYQVPLFYFFFHSKLEFSISILVWLTQVSNVFLLLE